MTRRCGELRVGTSGFQYDHWRGVLYEPGLPKRRWFERYAEAFDTVEVNNTFYRLPEAPTFEAWREQAPPDFRYALKFSRYGSHLKRLSDPEASVVLFLERCERLKSRLGPILVQLPPHWGVDLERLDGFVRALPRRRRWTLEFRDPSWLCEEVFALMEEHGVALCVHDMLDDHPQRLTTDWTYLRFHGAGGARYAGSYSPQLLSARARRLREHLDAGCDAYVYFNNDEGGHAVRDARALRRYVEGG